MLFTNYLVPLLPLASALSLHGLARRAHQTVALRLQSPESTPAAEKRSVLVSPKGSKAKRLVRKTVKKRACKAPHVPAANTTLGNGYNAGQPPVTTTAAPAPKPTSNSGWYKTDDWVSSCFKRELILVGLLLLRPVGLLVLRRSHSRHSRLPGPWAVLGSRPRVYQLQGQCCPENRYYQQDRREGKKGSPSTRQESVSVVRGPADVRFTGGMVLMDAWHMPTGCGTWPAWWQNGPNWPYGGEIDILEGVNEFSQNQVSIHTGSGCRIPWNTNDNQVRGRSKCELISDRYSHDRWLRFLQLRVLRDCQPRLRFSRPQVW
jgi:hypothetical protein